MTTTGSLIIQQAGWRNQWHGCSTGYYNEWYIAHVKCCCWWCCC